MVHGSEAANSYTGWFCRGSAVHGKGLRPLMVACGWVDRLWPGRPIGFDTACVCCGLELVLPRFLPCGGFSHGLAGY